MLKTRQMQLAELMASSPQMTIEQLADTVKCNKKTVYAWRELPEFQEYYHKLCEKRFRGYEALAIQKLMENANKGNQKAIEYLLNYIGYKPKDEIDINSGDINITIGGDADDKP